jgi:hypothetical protein
VSVFSLRAGGSSPKSGIFARCVEHLASGRRERFATGKELLAAAMRLLGHLEEPLQDQ